ncbi:MAG: TVP38/TMEM64 family protein [Candidatus Caenarcaniphilales bacterium]|nr:TVP38/TMEM64 family protein [Candidatus Caenarcaniphilales bacterium]
MKTSNLFKYLILFASLGFVIFSIAYFDVKSLLLNILRWIEELRYWGPIIFIGIYILASVLFVPGTLLTLGAGVLFGIAFGSIYVSIAATLGATAAFLVGRYLTRNLVAEKFEKNSTFQAINNAVAEEGWKIVSLIRLSPLFPFNLSNYLLGLTKVNLRDYFFGSWIGMIPGTIMYVYLGSLAGDIASIATGMNERSKTPIEWTLYLIGLLATVTVTIYVTKIAKRALSSKLPGTTNIPKQNRED